MRYFFERPLSTLETVVIEKLDSLETSVMVLLFFSFAQLIVQIYPVFSISKLSFQVYGNSLHTICFASLLLLMV